jgi:hypothetical protein
VLAATSDTDFTSLLITLDEQPDSCLCPVYVNVLGADVIHPLLLRY